MKIIRSRADFIVKYILPDNVRVILQPSFCAIGKQVIGDIDSGTHEVVENVADIPFPFAPGAVTFGSAWGVLDNQAYLDALMRMPEYQRKRGDDATVRAQEIVLRKQIAVDIDQLDDSDLEKVTYLYDEWTPGTDVSSGELQRYKGSLYRVLQAHTTQADWTPDTAVSLYTPLRQTQGAAPDEWVQPTGGHDAYNTGDRVTFNGAVYESLIDANTWSPSAYPAGWQLIN